MSSSHGAAPADDRVRGPLTRLPAVAKLVVLLVFLLVVGLTPARDGRLLVGWLAMAVALAVASFVRWRSVAARLVLDAPLAVLAVAQALLGRGPHVVVLGLHLSRPGLVVGGAVLAKGTVGVITVSALAACTTMAETLAALRRLGVPQWFCTLLGLAARQLDVLRDELGRLRLAVGLRHPDGGRRVVWHVGGRSLGLLFVRSAARAERLQLAADLHGGRLDTVVGTGSTR